MLALRIVSSDSSAPHAAEAWMSPHLTSWGMSTLLGKPQRRHRDGCGRPDLGAARISHVLRPAVKAGTPNPRGGPGALSSPDSPRPSRGDHHCLGRGAKMNKSTAIACAALLALAGAAGAADEALLEEAYNAAYYGDDAAKMQAIIKQGFDVNTRHGQQNTMLMYATGQGNLKVAKVLVDAGADLEARDEVGHTAL